MRRILSSFVWASQRQYFLKAGEQMIRLARTFSQLAYLSVFHKNLATQKIVLAFEPFYEARQVRTCRDRSRLVGGCRCLLSRHVVLIFCGDSCRDRSRHVATGRRCNLLDVNV